MSKKISVFYCIFSIAFFAALFLLFLMRLGDIKKTNTERISAGFDQVRHIVQTTYIRQESFDSQYFKDMAAKIFSLDKDLDLLVVYSYDTGIEYLRARDSRYLPGAAVQDIALLRGAPRFSYNTFSRTKIASSITVPRKSSFIIEGVYRILHDGELFEVVRDTVIILLVFAIITAALAVLLRLLDEGRPAASAAGKAAIPLPAPARIIGLKQKPAAPPEKAPAAVLPSGPPSADAGVSAAPAAREIPAKETPRESAAPPTGPKETVPVRPVPEEKPRAPAETEEKPAENQAPAEWRALLEKRLSLELERSAYNEQDLTLLILKIPGLPRESDDYRRLSHEIQSKLSFEDLTFEYPPDGFAVVLPNSNLDQSLGTLKNFLKTVESKLAGHYREPLCGLTSRGGRLMDGKRLLYEGEEALKKTEKEKLDTIIGFRPDPGKYRAYIAEQGPPEGDYEETP
jgi:hypothetical protein